MTPAAARHLVFGGYLLCPEPGTTQPPGSFFFHLQLQHQLPSCLSFPTLYSWRPPQPKRPTQLPQRFVASSPLKMVLSPSPAAPSRDRTALTHHHRGPFPSLCFQVFLLLHPNFQLIYFLHLSPTILMKTPSHVFRATAPLPPYVPYPPVCSLCRSSPSSLANTSTTLPLSPYITQS